MIPVSVGKHPYGEEDPREVIIIIIDMYIYIYIYIYIYTYVCISNHDDNNNSLQNTESGAGEQSLPQDCRAEAPIKGASCFCSRTPEHMYVK